MKLLMISDYFPPEIGSASFLFYELARELTGQGVKVSVITGFPRYHVDNDSYDSNYRKKIIIKEEKEGIEVLRVRIPDLSRRINILRGLSQFLAAFLYFLRGLPLKNYDCILAYSPPLPLGITAWALGKLKDKKTIVNVQDLFPKSAVDLGALRAEFMIRFFERLEKFVYLRNSCVSVHSQGNRDHILKVTKGTARTEVIPNWVNAEEIRPGDKINDFSLKHGLTDKFVVSFAGVLGDSQDLDIILETARLLKDYRDIVFIIVGDGRQKERLLERRMKENIENLKILPMQSKDKYPLVLNSSDIGLVTLKKIVKSPVVPSKILSLMAAGVPIVASLPQGGDAAKIISGSGAGICVEPQDTGMFAESIIKIYNDESLRKSFSAGARAFAEKNFSLKKCSRRYIEVFNSIQPLN